MDHTAAQFTSSFELTCPQAQFTADDPGEVPAVLGAAEEAARSGLHVVGFVSYDAAPGFDAAFRIPRSPEAPPATPLACFVGFAEADVAATLQPAPQGPEAAWCPDDSAGVHATAVASLRDSIAAGDAYLVNHTTRLRSRLSQPEGAFELYQRLVTNYGQGWHLFLETDEFAIACGSPELFFARDGAQITTRPMKGTAPRGRWALEDQTIAATLATSPKELAENVMVTDLLRNDLGRICRPGTIKVTGLGDLEQHPSLWQLTSTVTGELDERVGLPGCFAALFPSASVTGAPKIAAMSLIADHETSARGLYCGAVGYLPPGGDRAEFAVAIRTAVIDHLDHSVSYGSGGGISWESDPAAEWAEVLLKASSIERPARGLLAPDEGLIETMGFDPVTKSIANVHDHLERLAASAAYFGFAAPEDLTGLLDNAVRDLSAASRIRLELHADGSTKIIVAVLVPEGPAHQRLALDLEPVCSEEIRLFHKTTERRRYDERMARHPEADQVILCNERGEITETNRANLAVMLDGTWWTPPLSSGLLPGVGRAVALREGQIRERVILIDDLARAEGLATISSMRGWSTAELISAADDETLRGR